MSADGFRIQHARCFAADFEAFFQHSIYDQYVMFLAGALKDESGIPRAEEARNMAISGTAMRLTPHTAAPAAVSYCAIWF